MIRTLSIFSGIEAFSVAVQGLPFSLAGFAEIDPFASAVLSERFGSNLPGAPLSHNAPPNFGDVSAVDPESLPDVDLLVGGSPCQAFSIAGNRLSLADTRGNLTLTYAVLAHELVQSRGLKNALWENVPGVLSADDNAFGCFLAALVGADDALLPSPRPTGKKGNDLWTWSDKIDALRPSWPRFGMAAGPWARAAWRVLDAQWFGLAQRRERVFVVVDFGGGADPAAVLFEPQGMQGHSPPRREKGQGAAGDAAAGAGERRAFGGNRTSGPLDTSACLTANGGGQAMDFEVETFLVETAPTIRAGGNATGGDRPYGTDADTCDSLVAAFRTSGNCGAWETGDRTDALTTSTEPYSHVLAELAPTLPSRTKSGGGLGTDHDLDGGLIAHTLRGEGFDAGEDGTGRGTSIVPVYAIQERAVSGNLEAGPQGKGWQPDIGYTLEARHHMQAVAFSSKDFGGDAAVEISPTLRAMGHGESHANAGGQVAVATGWAVRRLTPVECARLQGFPDQHSRIPWRGKPSEACPDGPQYKTYGNSMAVPVIGWIAERLVKAMPA